MNHSFIPLFNIYKNAVTRKKTKVFLTYSQQTLFFVQFLMENSLILGYNTQLQRKKKFITLFLKYDLKNTPVISDFSLMSKTTMPRPILKGSRAIEHSNFILNLNSRDGRYARLLAKIR